MVGAIIESDVRFIGVQLKRAAFYYNWINQLVCRLSHHIQVLCNTFATYHIFFLTDQKDQSYTFGGKRFCNDVRDLCQNFLRLNRQNLTLFCIHTIIA